MQKTATVIIRMDPEQRKRLRMYCVKNDTSLQAIFLEAIREYMAKQGVALNE